MLYEYSHFGRCKRSNKVNVTDKKQTLFCDLTAEIRVEFNAEVDSKTAATSVHPGLSCLTFLASAALWIHATTNKWKKIKRECVALFAPLLTEQMQEISDLRVSVVHKSYGQVQ